MDAKLIYRFHLRNVSYSCSSLLLQLTRDPGISGNVDTRNSRSWPSVLLLEYCWWWWYCGTHNMREETRPLASNEGCTEIRLYCAWYPSLVGDNGGCGCLRRKAPIHQHGKKRKPKRNNKDCVWKTGMGDKLGEEDGRYVAGISMDSCWCIVLFELLEDEMVTGLAK